MERDLIEKLVNDELRSSNEVAEELQITKQGVAKLVARGELVPIKTMPNASLFLESDVEKIKIRKKLISSINLKKIWGGSTQQFIRDFDDIVRKEDVIGVYIYFYESEAALDGFYTTETIAKKDTLVSIRIPNFVIKYSDLSEEFFDGALCGYGGAGPSGSYDALVKGLEVPEEQARELYYARSIKYFREGNTWRYSMISRNHETNDEGYWDHQRMPYIYNNQFVQLLNVTKRDMELCFSENRKEKSIADEYKWFIPDVSTITIYPKKTAIQTGHYTVSSTDKTIYPVVVRDRNGHELWLDLNVREDAFLSQQERVMDIIQAFGLDLRNNDINNDKSAIIKAILNRIMKVDRAITISKYLDIN